MEKISKRAIEFLHHF